MMLIQYSSGAFFVIGLVLLANLPAILSGINHYHVHEICICIKGNLQSLFLSVNCLQMGYGYAESLVIKHLQLLVSK
jgi:hypothetical protein